MGVLIVLLVIGAALFLLSLVGKKDGFMKEDEDILKEHRNKKIK